MIKKFLQLFQVCATACLTRISCLSFEVNFVNNNELCTLYTTVTNQALILSSEIQYYIKDTIKVKIFFITYLKSFSAAAELLTDRQPTNCHNNIIHVKPIRSMDGWMTCDFTSFSTVFQSHQEDFWMIMKGCVQWNLVYGWKDFLLKRGLNLGLLD